MAKYYGRIGYAAESVEIEPGVWVNKPVERNYSGDVLRNTRRYENSGYATDNLNVNNMISIIADDFAFKHFGSLTYAEWMGTLWKVTNVEVAYPRLILTIGGVYNGQQT